jgi:hypothetical protein
VARAKVSIFAAQILVLISKAVVIALLEMVISHYLAEVFKNLFLLPLKLEEVVEELICFQ